MMVSACIKPTLSLES